MHPLADASPTQRCGAPYTAWPSTPHAIGAARAELVRRARDAGVSAAVLEDVRLAVSEACTNAVLHAFVTRDRRAERFSTATTVTTGRFEVWVADEGRGVVPAEPSPGAGVGLLLMAKVSDRLRIGTLPGGGLQVHMSFLVGG